MALARVDKQIDGSTIHLTFTFVPDYEREWRRFE
jgi:hypothetical protein